ncbi:MAG: gfo/Idh/MocA family oxidoreductase [Streptosporangiales bacterium]|nr:gfo/Idh/MocA family oxidoreductase [Streptosporangiales bacterium]
MTEPRRYAFVGTGHRAELYFTALLQTHTDVGSPVALCDVNGTRMGYYNELWSTARPGAEPLPTYHASEFDLLLERERPDAVVVTTIDATHHHYVCSALDRGVHVVVEKPLTTDAAGCRAIAAAAERSDAELVVTFNYRYAPRNSKVKELLAERVIGEVTSVHFEWLLDTVHGADYFRRWHRDKSRSGGLLVHKSSHHFDLVNWWLDAVPDTVFAFGHLRFYGRENAGARGLGPRHHRSHGAAEATSDPFAIDLAASHRLRRLYLDAEHEDGYLRDLDVFGEGITIEDNMALLVRYADRALLTYSLNAHAPWEGYRVAFNGTAGRLELDVCERSWVRPAGTEGVVGRGAVGGRPVIDPTAGGADGSDGGPGGAAPDEERAPRRPGTRLILQRHWEPARRIHGAEGEGGHGGHGGGDALLLDDVFRRTAADPLGRRAGYLDGIRSVLVGAAANRSIATGEPVRLADFGLPLGAEVG